MIDPKLKRALGQMIKGVEAVAARHEGVTRAYCSHCKICQRGCEPKAIENDGRIDARECLSCMECEATYHEEAVCPPLVGIERLLAKRDRTDKDDEKLAQLRKEREAVGWHAPRH